jgi:hypothetical protein
MVGANCWADEIVVKMGMKDGGREFIGRSRGKNERSAGKAEGELAGTKGIPVSRPGVPWRLIGWLVSVSVSTFA